MPGSEDLSEERVLLVEGLDDFHVVRHLRQSNARMPLFSIQSKDGIDQLLGSIRGEILAEGRMAVGIVMDANDNRDARWRAVSDRIRAGRIEPPNHPMPDGTIIDGNPRVGVWLMPDNESPGEIEDFVAGMIPPGDTVWPLSNNYIDSIPETDRKFPRGKVQRAKVHAWLAARSSPRPMGAAIGAGDLNLQAANSATFADWLRQLFG